MIQFLYSKKSYQLFEVKLRLLDSLGQNIFSMSLRHTGARQHKGEPFCVKSMSHRKEVLTADNNFYSYSHNKTMQTLEYFQLSGMQITSEDISNNYDDYHKSIKGIAISYILKKSDYSSN